MSSKTVKIGFIGSGGIANRHAAGYQTVPQAKIVAVADVVESLANEKRALWGAEKAYTDYRQMLKDSSIDAVNVCTPNGYHAEQVVAAAEAGKHILVEKPMANTVAECDAMISAARKAGVKLMVGHNLTFFPVVQEVKRLVMEKEIGRPIAIISRRHSDHYFQGWRADPNVNHGFLMEACVHQFYVARAVMGEFKRVSCMVARTSAESTYGDHVVMANWEFENDRYGTLTANQDGPHLASSDPFEVIGTDGQIYVPGVEAPLLPAPPLTLLKDGMMRQYMAAKPKSNYRPKQTKYEIDAVSLNSFNYEMQSFVDCVVNDKEPPNKGEDGRKVMQAILACYESSSKGMPITIGA